MSPLSDLLHLLACPICRQSLDLEQVSGAVVVRCRGCGRGFPVIDGIPVLIAAKEMSPPEQT